MAKIKYLVTGIDNVVLGNVIGNLAIGELPGEADVLVLNEQTPKAYSIGVSGAAKEISFAEFLTATVATERKRQSQRSSGEKLIQEIVEKSANQGQGPAVIPFKPQLLQ